MGGSPIDLSALGIPLTLPPSRWKHRMRIALPSCSAQGDVHSASGTLLFSLEGVNPEPLGQGTSGLVELYLSLIHI